MGEEPPINHTSNLDDQSNIGFEPRDDLFELYPYNGFKKPPRDFEVESERSYGSGLNLIHMAGRNISYQYDDDIPGNGFTRTSEIGTYLDDNPSGIGSERHNRLGEASISSRSVSSSAIEPLEREKPFTVERKDEDSHMHRWFKKPSRALSGLKFLLAMLLAAITLFCVVASKLSILSISKRLNKDGTNITHRFTCKDTKDLSKCEKETSFVMLCLLLMIPPAYTLLKMFVITCRKITHPWPTKLAILWVSFLYSFITNIINLRFLNLPKIQICL